MSEQFKAGDRVVWYIHAEHRPVYVRDSVPFRGRVTQAHENGVCGLAGTGIKVVDGHFSPHYRVEWDAFIDPHIDAYNGWFPESDLIAEVEYDKLVVREALVGH